MQQLSRRPGQSLAAHQGRRGAQFGNRCYNRFLKISPWVGARPQDDLIFQLAMIHFGT